MKIATWNVNGIRARQAQVMEWIQRDQPDVLCLQEIKATREQVPEPLREMPDYWCYWHGETSVLRCELAYPPQLFGGTASV